MPLPIAILLPHASLDMPPELEGRAILTPEQVFNEADAYVDRIFGVRDDVLYWLRFDAARAYIDVNRADDRIAPAHPLKSQPGDGIVKRITSYGAPVFAPGREPDAALEDRLIARYHAPWNRRLEQIANDPRVKLVIDCHSMAATGPNNFGDAGKLRPRICVANRGDARGERDPGKGKLTAPPALARRMRDLLDQAVADLAPLAPTGPNALINHPFAGGWDIWAYADGSKPWVMIEVNRALYVGPQTGETAVVPPDDRRLGDLRERLWRAIAAAASDA